MKDRTQILRIVFAVLMLASVRVDAQNPKPARACDMRFGGS